MFQDNLSSRQKGLTRQKMFSNIDCYGNLVLRLEYMIINNPLSCIPPLGVAVPVNNSVGVNAC